MLRTVVSIHLFHKPSLKMDIEDVDYIDPEILRRKGDELRGRLHAVAEILAKLQGDGWSRASGYELSYDLEFIWKGDSKSAKERLAELGIDPDEISVEEEWE